MHHSSPSPQEPPSASAGTPPSMKQGYLSLNITLERTSQDATQSPDVVSRVARMVEQDKRRRSCARVGGNHPLSNGGTRIKTTGAFGSGEGQQTGDEKIISRLSLFVETLLSILVAARIHVGRACSTSSSPSVGTPRQQSLAWTGYPNLSSPPRASRPDFLGCCGEDSRIALQVVRLCPPRAFCSPSHTLGRA